MEKIYDAFRKLGFRGHHFMAHFESVGFSRGQGKTWNQTARHPGDVCDIGIARFPYGEKHCLAEDAACTTECTVVVPLHSVQGAST